MICKKEKTSSKNFAVSSERYGFHPPPPPILNRVLSRTLNKTFCQGFSGKNMFPAFRVGFRGGYPLQRYPTISLNFCVWSTCTDWQWWNKYGFEWWFTWRGFWASISRGILGGEGPIWKIFAAQCGAESHLEKLCRTLWGQRAHLEIFCGASWS